jgi:hypothetical protein
MKAKKLIISAAIALQLNVMAKEPLHVSVREGFNHPESVVGHRKHLLVSNTGSELNPTAKDQDGYISLLDRKTGEIIDAKYFSGLNSPKGMHVKGNTLFVTDIDKVIAYNLRTKEQKFVIDMQNVDAAYLNDITKAIGGVYVSETYNNKLYKIKKKGKIKDIEFKGEPVSRINGVSKRPLSKVYVAGFGESNDNSGGIAKFGVVRKKLKNVKSSGVNDGIVIKNRKVYFTDWVDAQSSQGKLEVTKRRKNAKVKTIDLPFVLNGPSDIYADRRNNILYIPAMNEDKVISIPFSQLRPIKN